MAHIISGLLSLLSTILYFYGSILPKNEFVRTSIGVLERQLTHAALATDPATSSFTDPFLGHFGPLHLDCPFPKCAPERPSVIDTHFLFKPRTLDKELLVPATAFTSKNNSHVIKKAKEYLTSKSIYIFIPGFTESYQYSSEMNLTISALNNLQHDVIFVDWSFGNKEIYVATANSFVVGAQVGFLLDSLGIVDRAICVGFSLGAELCGTAGQWLKKNRHLTLPRCTGIDPSGILVPGCPSDVFLSRDDCQVVTIIHLTIFGSIPFGAAPNVNRGHCDFWFNYRKTPAGCDLLAKVKSAALFTSILQSDRAYEELANLLFCNHLAALRQYALSAILYPEYKYEFYECPSKWEAHNCDDIETQVKLSHRNTMLMPPFDSCKQTDSKNYCLCLKSKRESLYTHIKRANKMHSR